MNDKERLIDYLYGEMDEVEKRQFEKILADDPNLQAELAALGRTRKRLAGLPDIQPEPLIVSLPSSAINWKKWGLRIASVAAALLLLSVFNARLEWENGRLTFSMGKVKTEAPTVNPNEVLLAHLQARLLEKEQELDLKLERLDSSWQSRLLVRDQQLQQSWNQQLASYRTKRQADMKRFVQQLREEEMPELAGLVQNLQMEQKEELRLLLSEFWEYWQETRQADLQSIESEFVNVYQNVELNQTETEEILRGLLVSGAGK